MRACFALAIAVAFGASAPASGQTSADVVALQRVVFGLGTPALPETPERMEAQLRLASAYAAGAGIERDIELGCGLAQIVSRQSLRLGDDHPLHLRATAVAGQICADAPDLVRSLSRASCAHFGIARETLEYGPSSWLTVTSDGWSVEDASGVHDGEWAINCYDVVASIRLVRVEPPSGSRLHARQFVELIVWHQSYRDDGTIGNRSLEWYVDDLGLERGDIARLDNAGFVESRKALIWPTPPVPPELEGGATFRMLANGQIRWRFDRAPQLGGGTIAAER